MTEKEKFELENLRKSVQLLRHELRICKDMDKIWKETKVLELKSSLFQALCELDRRQGVIEDLSHQLHLLLSIPVDKSKTNNRRRYNKVTP